MTNPTVPAPVRRIAILNPYLKCGLNESSEVEGVLRFLAAAKRLGIEAAMVSGNEEIYAFDPDFVIALSYQEPKLTPYPTYGSLAMPVNWVKGSPRFMRNIFSYDGYLIITDAVQNWLQALCKQANKPFYSANTAFSLGKTDFQPIDFTRARAAYMGVNWDGARHYQLFQYFAQGDYLQCFGPEKSWAPYPATLYGGKVPFDGVSALANYAKYGIGLHINHPDFDREGTPTCRSFEIPAASAMMISSQNTYTQRHFGDTCLYVDVSLPTPQLAQAIKEHIDWIRANPAQAQEMAKAAHDIFNQCLAVEVQLQNVINMHYEVMKNDHWQKPAKTTLSTAHAMPKITYLIPVTDALTIQPLLQDLSNQTYENIDVLLLADQGNPNLIRDLETFNSKQCKVFVYNQQDQNQALIHYLLANNSSWLGILKANDRVFPHHSALLMKTYEQSNHNRQLESIIMVFSNSLEHAEQAILEDKLQDPHMIYLKSKTRVANLTPCTPIPLCAVVIKFNEAMQAALPSLNFFADIQFNFSTSEAPLDLALHNSIITCSSYVPSNKRANAAQHLAYLLIENATSSLLFKANSCGSNGALMVETNKSL